MRRWCAYSLVLMLSLGGTGCRSAGASGGGYATFQERDLRAAQRFNDEGLRAVERGDFAEAERLFRAALAADVYYPAAHNNLGITLLEQNRIYESAWEFQYAAKLMPKSAEPRFNLATLLERVGNHEGAEESYREALALEPENIEVMGHLARVYIKTGRRDQTTRDLLTKLATRADRGSWDRWAREWLMRLDQPDGGLATK